MDQTTSTHADDQLAVLRRLADELLQVPVGAPIDGVKGKEFVLRFRALDFTCSGGSLPSAWEPDDDSAVAVNLDGTEVEFGASDTDCIAEERVDLEPEERAVFDALTNTPQTVVEVAYKVGLPQVTVRNILDIGEQAGIATNTAGARWWLGEESRYVRRPQSPFWTEVQA